MEAISKIEKHYNPKSFEHDELMQAAMIHFLEIVGEACRSLSSGFREKFNHVKWSNPIGFRNILVHQYFEIDIILVKRVIEGELQNFKGQIKSLLSSI